MLHRHVGLSRPFYVNKIYSFIHSFIHSYIQAVFETYLLFRAPLGCIHFETMRPGILLCTPLVYSYAIWVKKRAHIRRTCAKNVRPVAKMCAPGAECTVNFEHCQVCMGLYT